MIPPLSRQIFRPLLLGEEKVTNMITFFQSRNGLNKVQRPRCLDLRSILNDIKNGKWGPDIQKIRSLSLLGDKKSSKELKNKMPVIMFGGKFKGQKIADLETPSNLVVLDFDKIENIKVLEDKKNKIKNDAYTKACFISTTGFGLKVLVEVDSDTDNTTHHEYFNAIKDYYATNYPDIIQYWDDSSKNINRLCFVSHDPDLYYNPNSSIWTKRVPISKGKAYTLASSTTKVQSCSCTGIIGKEAERIIKRLEGGWDAHPMIDGHRHDSTYFRAKDLCECGVSKDIAFRYFERFKKDANDPDDIDRQINNAYQKNEFNIRKL